ncbi:ABC transporter substrate-binding protein [Alteribacter aurantiacus]|uniref:ABC transporter substrate-binding protein n=1 Tax=Alteribacter aurantiacus TaxID=254410 RepID=UPI0004161E65|nr:ABC transporter substrate-binding protein [Alteribacter aurantiacus]
MKQPKVTGLALGLGLLTLTACAQTEMEQDNAGDTSTDNQTEETNTAGDVEETGELTIYTAGPGGMAEQLVEAFEEKTGIDVQMYQGTTGDVLGRLEAEQGNPIADVVVLASMPPAMQFKEDGMIMPYESEYADQLHDGWYDEDHHYYGFSAAALGISYNTNMVDEAPTDWSDLTGEAFADQLAIPDPQQSGTARDFVAAYIQQEGDAGWELFEELSENGLSLEGANNPALQTVISGANSAVMAGVDYMVYNNIEGGEPIDIAFPESGTTITPRPAFVLDSAQNVDSAQKYIDFILSDRGQEIVADNYLLPGRTDIDAHEDRAPLEDIAELDFDWDYLEENGQDIINDFISIVR